MEKISNEKKEGSQLDEKEGGERNKQLQLHINTKSANTDCVHIHSQQQPLNGVTSKRTSTGWTSWLAWLIVYIVVPWVLGCLICWLLIELNPWLVGQLIGWLRAG